MTMMMNNIFPALGLGIIKGILIRCQIKVFGYKTSASTNLPAVVPKCHECHWTDNIDLFLLSQLLKPPKKEKKKYYAPPPPTYGYHVSLAPFAAKRIHVTDMAWQNSGELVRWSLRWVWPSCQVSKEYFIFKYQNCHWDLSLFGLILKMQMSDDTTCPVDILMDTNDNTLPLNSHTYFYAQYWFFKWKTRRLESPSSWIKHSKMLCAGVSATDENQTLLLFGVSWILLNRFFYFLFISYLFYENIVE